MTLDELIGGEGTCPQLLFFLSELEVGIQGGGLPPVMTDVMTDSLTVTTGTLPPVLPVAQHTAAAAAQLVIKSSESTKTVN